MSKSLHTEQQRRITELEALVSGQATEIDRLTKALDECEQRATRLILDIQKVTQKGTA